MFVAIAQVFLNEFLDFSVLENVVFECGGNVDERHAGLDPVLEVDVLVQVVRGPEVDKLNSMAGTADSVDTPKTLDNAYRIPVYIIVN